MADESGSNSSSYPVKVDVGGRSIIVRVDGKSLENLRKRDRDTIELVQITANAALVSLEEKTALDDLPDPSPTATPPETVNVKENQSEWTHDAELMLLDIFKEVESGKIPFKKKWHHISTKMAGKSGGVFIFTSEKCRLKIKNLKERQARLKLKRNKSGEGATDDDLEDELDDCFKSMPDINPKFVMESSTSDSKSDALDSTPCPSPLPSTVTCGTAIPLPSSKSRWLGGVHRCVDKQACKADGIVNLLQKRNGAKRKTTTMGNRRGIDIVKTMMEDRESAAERRHQEKMAAFNALIQAIKK